MVARQANVAVSCQVHCKGIVRGEKVYSLGGGGSRKNVDDNKELKMLILLLPILILSLQTARCPSA